MGWDCGVWGDEVGYFEPRNTQNTRKKDCAMNDMIYSDEVYAIQGAVFEVYKTLGAGFLEAVYQESLEEELKIRGIPFEAQSEIKISYKGKELRQFYKADIVCYDKIILELKAVSNLLPEHSAQLFNYLRGTKMKLGLLINFGHYPGVEIKRIAL
jgi:GxxExxY protein